MFGEVLKLGAPGGVGFLVGLLLMTWIEPQTLGGRALLLAICIAAAVVLSSFVRFVASLFRRADTGKRNNGG